MYLMVLMMINKRIQCKYLEVYCKQLTKCIVFVCEYVLLDFLQKINIHIET